MAEQKFPFPLRSANRKFPYNPFAAGAKGDPDDTVSYIQPPGVEFFRPWLAVPNGPAFIFPLGVEGFSLSIDPNLGIHKYYGDNKVTVNVTHRGEEHITLSGNFLGSSAEDSLSQIRDVIYAVQPVGGKILYLPGILSYAQRVAVARFSSDKPAEGRGTDMTYTIEFVRTGIEQKYTDPDLASPVTQPTSSKVKASTRVFKVTSSVNTLQKIAALKKVGWQSIYKKNLALFNRLKVTAHTAPTYHIKIGTSIYY